MASLIVSDSAPPSMQSMPLTEDGPFIKFLKPKIIFSTTMVFHEQKVKKYSNTRKHWDIKLFESRRYR